MKSPKKMKAKRKNLPATSKMVLAGAKSDITIPFFSNVLQPNDDTIIKKGAGKGLAIYDEIERDTHAWAVLQKRKKALVAREWEVRPGGKDQIDLDAAEFVENQLRALPFDRICEDLLDATLKGFAISEVVWASDGKNLIVDRILNHDQRRFVFDFDWNPRLLTRENMMDGLELPAAKFVVHRHGVKGNNPYGLGLGTRLFWPTVFKREGIAFWMVFLEKFAAPTVLGKMPFGLSEAEEKKLLETLAAVAQNKSILTPMGVDVSFLEAARSGSVSYKEWCSYWDSQISICVNGETLTTEIQGGGSRAAAETHADVLQQLVDADADLLSSTLRESLFTWLVDYNFPGAKVPEVWRLRPANAKAEAETSEKQAAATMATDKALRQVVATSAAFERDDDARSYIQEMSPRDLDAEMLDRLIAIRKSDKLRENPSTKKKVRDDPDLKPGSDTPGFADVDKVDETGVQQDYVIRLEDMAEVWGTERFDAMRGVLDAADSLDAAAKAALELGAGWKPDDYADVIQLALTASAYAGRSAVIAELDDASSFADVDVFSQPFQEQIDFFRQKAPRPTDKWTDILRGDHDRAFMVAGAKDIAMLEDFQNAIGDAIENGTSLDAFRKDFDQIVAKYGWSYNGKRGWRSKVIFETNIRTSYMAGRLKQMRDPDVLKMRPFWQYRHGQTRTPVNPRRAHKAWDGLILRADDPWWDQHYPPNDWKCSCGVRTLSARDLKALGKSGPDESPETRKVTVFDKITKEPRDQVQGVGYGFEYQPGDLWERGLVPSQIDKLAAKSAFTVDDAGPIADLVEGGRPFAAKELKPGKDAEFYVDAFLKPFAAARRKAVLFKDKAGGTVPISDELFRDAKGDLKVMKRGREVYAAQLAETIRDPDEIWLGVATVKIPDDQGGGTELVIDRKYIRVDPKTGLLAIFELLRGKWSAKTAFHPTKKRSVKTDVNVIQKRRSGVLLYKRQ